MDGSWLTAFAGGVMIGLAGAIYLLVNGRIMGVSSILGGLFGGGGPSPRSERLAFLLALFAFPALAVAMSGQGQTTNLTSNALVLVAGGLLVGVGTRLALGCTSGHGVCGISRLSPRGIAATLIYIVAGALFMGLMRHGLGWV
jgi:uncharacterized membrane protein YedE/YeeE